MKILVFGAAFDPPHNGHMTMAKEVAIKGIADLVIMVPCARHAFDKIMSPARDRMAMTQMMVNHLNKKVGNFFELSDIEIKRPGLSLTYETLDQIAKLYPTDEIGWLMGSDQLPKFNLWHEYKEMLAKYPFYVYPRKGYPFEPWLNGMIEIKDVPIVDLASSEVRAKYQANGSITGMVLPEVEKYVKENNLWKK